MTSKMKTTQKWARPQLHYLKNLLMTPQFDRHNTAVVGWHPDPTHCSSVSLSWCPIVRESQCLNVPVSNWPSVLSSHCPGVPVTWGYKQNTWIGGGGRILNIANDDSQILFTILFITVIHNSFASYTQKIYLKFWHERLAFHSVGIWVVDWQQR